MSFFLPGRLIEFEYFQSEPDIEYDRIAKPYRKEMDFAFFAVNFGYSKSEYEMLTPTEKAFIYKAWENKSVSDSYHMYNAVFTAVYNVNRKKNKRALKLWKKNKTRRGDMEIIHDNLEIIEEVDKKEGRTWVNTIYKKVGIKLPKKGGESNG